VEKREKCEFMLSFVYLFRVNFFLQIEKGEFVIGTACFGSFLFVFLFPFQFHGLMLLDK